MDRKIAEVLVEELERRPGKVITPYRDKLISLLVAQDIHEKARARLLINNLATPKIPKYNMFSIALPDNKYALTIEETYSYLNLSLHRILRNREVRQYNPSMIEKVVDFLFARIGVYSPDILVRKIAANEALVKLMDECEHPFSLLGEFQDIDYSQPERIVFSRVSPILVIPNVKDYAKISEWERQYTAVEKEIESVFGQI